MLSDLVLRDDLATLSHADLDDALTELCAHMNAAEHRLLQFIAEWDARGLCNTYGVKSCAHWLNHKCGIDLGAAREKVRVARALKDLPLISAAFAAGTVSYSKVRAITRAATPRSEGVLLGYAQHATAAQIERIVAGFRRLERVTDPERILRQRRMRGLKWHFDDDGMLVLHGRFPPEEGALILKAIETLQDRMYREERASEDDDVTVRVHGRIEQDVDCASSARRADALLRLVESGVAAPDGAGLNGAERTLVVLHVPVPASDAQAPQGVPEIEDGPVINPEVARRIACDAGMVVHTEDDGGNVVSISRRSRSVPHWLQRAVRHRDGGCRFPGCTQRHLVDAHHIQHWADGGETSLDNLVQLCRHHHRLVHEEGFGCERGETGEVRFTQPDGTPIPEAFVLKRGDYRDIADLNVRRGLAITPRTCSGGWDGRRVDYGEAVAQVWYATHGTCEIPNPPPREPIDFDAPHARLCWPGAWECEMERRRGSAGG